MNRENLLRVADAIEKSYLAGVGFNMRGYVERDFGEVDMTGRACGTTACIAGYAVALAQPRKTFFGFGTPVSDEKSLCAVDLAFVARDARYWLDLTRAQADELFEGAPKDVQLHHVRPSQAVATLRYAVERGVINWDAAQTWAAEQKAEAR